MALTSTASALSWNLEMLVFVEGGKTLRARTSLDLVLGLYGGVREKTDLMNTAVPQIFLTPNLNLPQLPNIFSPLPITLLMTCN